MRSRKRPVDLARKNIGKICKAAFVESPLPTTYSQQLSLKYSKWINAPQYTRGSFYLVIWLNILIQQASWHLCMVQGITRRSFARMIERPSQIWRMRYQWYPQNPNQKAVFFSHLVTTNRIFFDADETSSIEGL